MPPKKKPTAKSTSDTAKSTSGTESCCICCQSLNVTKDEVLFCGGSCQQWAHRYCLGVSVMAYKIIKEKGRQFCCFTCLQVSQQDEIEQLKTEVRSTPSQDVSSAGPTVPRSYASTVSTSESNTPKPTKTNTILESNRKFNVVIYGIGECKQRAKWPERLASDLSKVGSVLMVH